MATILIIEDEAGLREEVIDWLILEDYEALGAPDGIAGLELAVHHQPDLIICDIAMPRLDGYGVLLELQARSLTRSIPFIFMTAKAAHEDIRHGMALGADDYITKPFTRLELLQSIQTRLQKKAKQEQDRAQELEDRIDGDANQAERQQQQPNDRVEHQGEQRQRPAHHEQNQPQDEGPHRSLH